MTDRTFGHAIYGCAECCNYGFVGYNSFYLSPDPMSGVIGGGGQYTSWAINVCTGEIDDAGAVGWQSSNTSVATIDLNGWASFVGAGTSTISAVARLQSVNNPSCRPQTFQASGPVSVVPCDFSITPANVLAKDCSGQNQNSNIFNTTITPSPAACSVDQVKSTCSEKRTGNIDFVVASPHCVYNLGNPSGQVTYFAGPKLSNGTAGTIDMSFSLLFNGKVTVTETDNATVTCP